MKPTTQIFTDPIFSNPRLASIYDSFDSSTRYDLRPYLEIIKQLGAKFVIDLGCGTGTFAVLLRENGINVLGVDPALASIEVAQSKTGAETVEWLVGDASILPASTADVVVMTSNVAQAITEQAQWDLTLNKIKGSLKPKGYLIFETRNPVFQAWDEWNKKDSFQSISVPGEGLVDGWVELTKNDFPLISFRWTYVFHKDNVLLTSDSTLLFRDQAQVKQDLLSHGYEIEDVREAPDRLGREYVFIARLQ